MVSAIELGKSLYMLIIPMPLFEKLSSGVESSGFDELKPCQWFMVAATASFPTRHKMPRPAFFV